MRAIERWMREWVLGVLQESYPEAVWDRSLICINEEVVVEDYGGAILGIHWDDCCQKIAQQLPPNLSFWDGLLFPPEHVAPRHRRLRVAYYPHVRAGHAFFPIRYADILQGLGRVYPYLAVSAYMLRGPYRVNSCRPGEKVDQPSIFSFDMHPSELMLAHLSFDMRPSELMLAHLTVQGSGSIIDPEAVFERALLEVLG